jgi:hypothetical protein
MKRRGIPARRTVIATCVAVLAAGGVAYAALFSNFATVGGSTISTSSANLKVSTDGINYATHVDGFDFSNIMPGQQLQPEDGKTIYLRNDGTTRLALHIAANPLASSSVTNVDTSRVYLALTRASTTDTQQLPLSSLTSGQASSLSYVLNPGQEISYRLQVRVDEGAVSDTTVQSVIGGLTLVFDGAADNT